MQAAIDLVRQRGGEVVAAVCIIELNFLRGRERIENKSESQALFAKREPCKILDFARPVRLQRRKKRDDRNCQHNDLASDCESGRAFAARVRQT